MSDDVARSTTRSHPAHAHSDTVIEKAHRLLDENRVQLSPRYRDLCIVCGDTGVYEVWAHAEGVACTCYQDSAPRPVPRCSHAIAAMVAWHDRMYVSAFGPTPDAPTGFAAITPGVAA